MPRARQGSLASSAVTPGTQRYDPMTVLSTEASESPLPARGGRSTNLASAFVGARIIACSSEAAGCEAENLLYESRDLVWRARRGAKAARVALRLSAAGAPRLGFGADFVRSVGWRCAPGHAPVQATVEASSDGDAYRVLLTLTTPDASAGEFHLWDLPSALDLTRERHVRFTLDGDAQLSSLLCCSENARTAAQALAATATPQRSDDEEDEDAAAARRALDETADELARKIDALRESEKRSRELFAALDRRDARAESSSSTDQDVTRPSSYATSTVTSPNRMPPSAASSVVGPSPGTARLEAALAGARAARTRAERDCDAAERRRRAEPTFPRAFWDDAQSALVLPDAAGPPPLSALALPDGARDAAGPPPAAAPRRPAADAAGGGPAVGSAARGAAPAAFDGAAVEAGLRALADRIDAFAESRERAVPEQNSAAIEALAARVDALARDFEARPRAAGAVDAVASERPPMAPDTGCEPPAPRPAPQLSPAAGSEPPRPTAREASPPRATAVPAWSPRSTVPGLRRGPARGGGADAPPRPLPPPEMPPRAAPVAAPVAASPPRSPPRRAEHAPSPRRAEVATSPLRRAEPPAAEPPAPQRRGPSVAAVTEALARDSVDDRDAETHLTRCILRAALRRKLRRRDRKAAELKMNEFMRATRRVAKA